MIRYHFNKFKDVFGGVHVLLVCTSIGVFGEVFNRDDVLELVRGVLSVLNGDGMCIEWHSCSYCCLASTPNCKSFLKL